MSNAKLGFTYKLTYSEAGVVVAQQEVQNLLPNEALTYIINAAFLKGAQFEDFYLSLYTNNYTPLPADKASTFPAVAGEFMGSGTVERPRVNLVHVGGGLFSNVQSPLVITPTAAATVYGCALFTVSGKGSTDGILVSAARFDSPEVLKVGKEVKVEASIQLNN